MTGVPHTPGRRIAALFVLCLACALSAESARVLDLAGRELDPFTGTDRIAVFIFVSPDCPISNRYAPELRRLAALFGARDVAFRLVYPDPDASPDRITAHLAEYGYSTVALRDPAHRFANLTGATITPEAVVFDSRRLVYRGRIDNQFVRLGVRRPAASERDLEQVLEQLLAGRPVVPFVRPAIGCLFSGAR